MIRKGQVQGIGGRDMRAQAAFVAGLFTIMLPETAEPQVQAGADPAFATQPTRPCRG